MLRSVAYLIPQSQENPHNDGTPLLDLWVGGKNRAKKVTLATSRKSGKIFSRMDIAKILHYVLKKQENFFVSIRSKILRELLFFCYAQKKRSKRKCERTASGKKKHAVYLVRYESQGQGAKALPTAPLTFLRPAVLRLRFFFFFCRFFLFFQGSLLSKSI